MSEHKYSKTDSFTLVKMKLCLVVKTSDGSLVDAVFIAKLKNDYLFEGFKVRKDSAEFKPLGRCQHSVSYLISQLFDQSVNQSINQSIDQPTLKREYRPIQRVQNTAARLIVGARRFDHLTPILKDLHWLPVPARLEFKGALSLYLASF